MLENNKPFVDTVDAELAWIEQAPLTPAVRRYIALAVDCSYPDRYKERGDTTNPLEHRREVPIKCAASPRLSRHELREGTLALKRVVDGSEMRHRRSARRA